MNIPEAAVEAAGIYTAAFLLIFRATEREVAA